jgi:hypothetical protein
MSSKLIQILFLGLTLESAELRLMAQSRTFLSNLGEASAGSVLVGSNAWIATPFITGNVPGPGGYRLDSVEILIDSLIGSPFDLALSIHRSSRAGVPDSTGWSLGKQNPVSSGVVSFAASGIILSDLSLYWVVVTSGNVTPQDSYTWSISSTDSYESRDGWLLGDYYSSPDAEAWTRINYTYVQLAINATPIPEPSAWALLVLGGGALLVAARRGRERRRIL